MDLVSILSIFVRACVGSSSANEVGGNAIRQIQVGNVVQGEVLA
jgi:hypothetical protein